MQDLNEIQIGENLKKAQLTILEEFDRVCKILNLPYCLAWGTSLGAKRHQGFIPWDDDIDVCMMNSDLEILQNNRHLFKSHFFLQDHNNDPEYDLTISRLRNNNTTLIEKNEADRDINHGIFIDIYPLFNTPKDGFRATYLLIVSMLYRLMLYGRVPQNRGFLNKYGSYILLKITPSNFRKKMVASCYKILRSTSSTGYLSSLYGNHSKVRYPSNWFFPPKIVNFESLKLPVQAEHEKYLEKSYGEYMTLPPKEKQKYHHDYLFIDFDNSYLNYRGKYYCKEK